MEHVVLMNFARDSLLFDLVNILYDRFVSYSRQPLSLGFGVFCIAEIYLAFNAQLLFEILGAC